MPAQEDIVQALGRVELFRVLATHEDLQFLADRVRLRRLKDGETVYRKGDEGDSFFVVFSGAVQLLATAESGEDILLSTHSADEAFGEEILVPGGRREAEARAFAGSTVIEILRADFAAMTCRKAGKGPWVDAYVTNRALQLMIRRFGIISDLSREEIHRWLGQMRFVEFKQGDVIFRTGDPGDDLYIVIRGEVGIYAGSDFGPWTFIKSLSPGEHFGELALLCNTTRTATVSALSDTVLGAISADSFREVFAESEPLRNRILAAISAYKGELPQSVTTFLAAHQGASPAEGGLESREFPALPVNPALRRRAERPPKGFRFIEDKHSPDGGLAACLSMIAGTFGLPVSIARVRRLIGEGGGRDPFASLERAAPRLGMKVEFCRADSESLWTAPLPAVIPGRGGGLALIVAANSHTITIADPESGTHQIPPAEFFQGWNGVLAILTAGQAFLKLEREPSKYKRYTPLIRQHSKVLVRAFVAALGVNMLALVPGWITGQIVDRIATKGQHGLLPWLLLAMLTVAVSKATLALGREYGLLVARRGIATELMSAFMRHLFDLPLVFFTRVQLGEMLERINENDTLREMLSDTIVTTLLDLITLSVLVCAMFFMNPGLALVTLAILPLYVGLSLFSIPYLNRCNFALFEARSKERGTMAESLFGLATIKSMSGEETAFTRWRDRFVDSQEQAQRSALVKTGFSSANELIAALATLLMFWYGTRLVIRPDHPFAIGQLMTFASWAMLIFPPVQNIVSLISRFQAFSIGVDRMNMILDSPSEPMQPPPSAPALPAGTLEMRMEKVHFSYGEDQPKILSDISFEAASGQMVAIVGRSGAGKTTLINLLVRFYDPTTGRISLNGTDIRQFGLTDYRNQVGVVLQENFLFTGTIRENLTLGCPNASQEEIDEAVHLAAADNFIRRMPQGIDTMLVERGHNLSGGQRQRLAIARALLRKPRILIFDEATSSLDNESERAIQKNMSSIGRNRIFLVIAHRLSTIRNADKILVIEQGRIVEQGRHHELIELNGLYSHLLRMALS